MAWKATFDTGVACFKRGDFANALTYMNQAAELESDAFVIYDSRAAVHEKVGNYKAALLDSKRVIDLAPDRWQGYVRSARLFDLLGKHESVIKMVDHALNRLRPDDTRRNSQLLELKNKAAAAQVDSKKQRSSQVARFSYLLGKLPVETLLEIFSILIDEDHTWSIKLSHVCGHWRRILINTPTVWQTLVLSRKHPLQRAKLWKQRAKNHISCLVVDMSELDRSFVFTELRDISWDDLRSLRISGRAFLELHRTLSDVSTSHSFSKLDKLILFDCASYNLLSSCLSGPSWNLKVLHLSGTVFMQDEWWPRIQQLRELYLSGDIGPLSPLSFSAFPLLEKFVLASPSRFAIDPFLGNDDFPISMGNLKHIEFRGSESHFNFVSAIMAPSITHFVITDIAVKVNETLLQMASRPSLVELRISNCSLSLSILPTLLSSTPNLETLQVSGIHEVANEVLDFLATRTESIHNIPCRALKHVDVSRCSDLTTSSLYGFVRARVKYASEPPQSADNHNCVVIASLNVDGCPNIEADLLPWFRSKVARFSCVYATKKDFTKDRRRNPQV